MKSILIVDDNEDNLFVIKALVETMIPGCNVITANSGKIGIEKALEVKPDMILLDVLMPKMNGFEVCEQLKKNLQTSGIPIVLLTAIDNNSTNRTMGLKYGADAFLSKPVDENELSSLIKAMLKKKEKHDTLLSIVTEKTFELKNKSEKFKIIFENIKDAVFVFGWNRETNDLNLLETNHIVCKSLGYSKDELTALLPDKMIPYEQRYKIEDILTELKINNIYSCELDVVKKNGVTFPVELKVTTFSVDKEDILLFVARDISKRKEMENSLQESFFKLERSLNQVIDVLALTVETRDPYTSGHQKRVAEIAKSIAKEMGLPVKTQQTIFMASMIHDIGKINVPAEILSKPGKLDEVEFALVKQHPVTGYEITKGIDFDRPISKIIRQHHERIDGSGYPDGLKGDDILLESRIVGVADVLEAMSSHRPYRPSLGMEAALEEIKKNSGILYDEKVVKVCSKLVENDLINVT